MRIINCQRQILQYSGLLFVTLAGALLAQESPSPSAFPAVTPFPTETVTPIPDVTVAPVPSVTVAPSPGATATALRNVRISFLPPPLEGTISLGIYDSGGKLVRVLHREAQLDKFTIGADALLTKWDGKDDHGQDLPPGKYHARGYLVGDLKVENLGKETAAATSPEASGPVEVKLMSNPLVKTGRPMLNLTIGFDRQNSFLKTADDLPLFTISPDTNVTRAFATKNTDKSLDAWLDNGAGVEHLRVLNVDKMMAFDCGEVELK